METILLLGLSNALAATLLAVVALAGTFAFRRRPAVVHALWLLVLLKLVTPPLVSVPVEWSFEPADMPPADVSVSMPELVIIDLPEVGDVPSVAAAEQPAPDTLVTADNTPVAATPWWEPIPWATVAGASWLTGAAAWFVLAGVRSARFARLLRHATPAPRAVEQIARRIAKRMGLAAVPPVLLVPGRVSPLVWAVGRARLYLPAELIGQVPEGQLATLLAHELAHLRRRDHWVRVLELATGGLYWWLPVIWYARHALREAEEQCCDAWVVAVLPDSGRCYAEALVEAIDFLAEDGRPMPGLATGLGSFVDLKRRLTMILRGKTPRTLGWQGGLAVLALGAVVLPLLPTLVRGGPDEEQDDAKRELIRKELFRVQDRDRVVDKDALDRTRREVKELEEQLERKLREIKEIAKKLEDASDRLAKAEGGRGESRTIRIEIVGVGERRVERDGPQPRPGTPAAPGRGPGAAPEPRPGTRPPDGRGNPGGEAGRRMDDLERKLDSIMRELENLRKEMRPGRGGAGDGGRGGLGGGTGGLGGGSGGGSGSGSRGGSGGGSRGGSGGFGGTPEVPRPPTVPTPPRPPRPPEEIDR